MAKTSPKMFMNKERSRGTTEVSKTDKKKAQLNDYLMETFRRTSDVKKTISLARKALFVIDARPLEDYLMHVSTHFKPKFSKMCEKGNDGSPEESAKKGAGRNRAKAVK